MKITTIIIALIVVFGGALTTNNQSFAQMCGGEKRTFKLMVHTFNNKPTRVTHKGKDAYYLYDVCVGDEIEWQLVGPKKRFFVRFAANTPFSGGGEKPSSNGKVMVIIDNNAPPGGDYKYDIGIGTEVWDPRIIISR